VAAGSEAADLVEEAARVDRRPAVQLDLRVPPLGAAITQRQIARINSTNLYYRETPLMESSMARK
jgi:hypothetical protein